MFKFLGKALASMVLTKGARKAVGKAKPSPKAAGKAPTAKNAAISQVQAQARELLTEDRAELIRQAMKVRAAKQTILADLSDDDRARLVATAMKALLNEGREKKE